MGDKIFKIVATLATLEYTENATNEVISEVEKEIKAFLKGTDYPALDLFKNVDINNIEELKSEKIKPLKRIALMLVGKRRIVQAIEKVSNLKERV